MNKINLNAAQPILGEFPAEYGVNNGRPYARDASAISGDGDVSVHFDNLEGALIREIEKADVIYGCVAWLTNERILSALASKEVSIVVQKEDFLRPDMNKHKGWELKLRRQYDALKVPSGIWSAHHGKLRFEQSQESAIRCVGNYNRDKSPAFPRMHHKFIVFARERIRTWVYEEEYEHEGQWHTNAWEIREIDGIDPYAVWTGSFNFTQNAVMSLENAVVIRKEEIVRAYDREYGHVYSLSEALDWSQDWIAPEHKIEFIGS